MSDTDKELLISEIDKYDDYNSLIIKYSKNDRTLYELLNDEVKMKKILINNEYGLLGNLLYKYREMLDGDILVHLCIKDCAINGGKKSTFLAMLEEDIEFRNKIFADNKNFDLLVENFGYVIINYIDASLKDNKDYIISIIKNKEVKKRFAPEDLRYLNDNLRGDKDIVYEVFKSRKLISDNTYKYGSLRDMYKELLTKLKVMERAKYGLFILPDELKEDLEIVWFMLIKLYGFIPKKDKYTLKSLFYEYTDKQKDELVFGKIYSRQLCFSDELPLSLLNDREFIENIIDVDEKNDKKYLMKVYNIKKKRGPKRNKEYAKMAEEAELIRFPGITEMRDFYFEYAIEFFDEAIEKYPYIHGPYCDKAKCLVKLGKLDEAINLLKGIINSKELKDADPSYYSSFSLVSSHYKKYSYELFIELLKRELADVEAKKKRGYVYRPRNKRDY